MRRRTLAAAERFPLSLPVVSAGAETEKRTASQARSRGAHAQLSAYPRLQNASRTSCAGISPSWPGAVQWPLHPQPSGRRAGCGQAPFSSFTTGMKYGQANPVSLEFEFAGRAIVISRRQFWLAEPGIGTWRSDAPILGMPHVSPHLRDMGQRTPPGNFRDAGSARKKRQALGCSNLVGGDSLWIALRR